MRSTILITLLLAFTSCFSQETMNIKADTALMVVGTFTLKSNLIHNIRVNLYLQEKRIDSLVVSGNQEFGFYLSRNRQYTIEITRDGFVRKTIAVSTEIPDEVKTKSYFTFGYTMPLDRKDGTDDDKNVKSIEDLPTAYIFYNDRINKFDSTREYTKALKEKFYQARQAAKQNKPLSDSR